MSGPSNSLVSVATTDITPTLPTYRISNKPGEDTATVTLRFNPGRAPLRPGTGVRPQAGLQPTDGRWDIGAALVGDTDLGAPPYLAAFRITAEAQAQAGAARGGLRVGGIGCVCGVGDRCGAPGVKPLQVTAKRAPVYAGALCGVTICNDASAITSPAVTSITLADTVLYSEIVPSRGDGDVACSAYALIEPEGWV